MILHTSFCFIEMQTLLRSQVHGDVVLRRYDVIVCLIPNTQFHTTIDLFLPICFDAPDQTVKCECRVKKSESSNCCLCRCSKSEI